MTLLLTTLVALPAAQAAPNLTRDLGQRLESEVRHRAQLPAQAEVVVNQVRISNDVLAQGARAIRRVELPNGEDGLGRVAAKALLIGNDGSEAWTWVQAQVDASVPTVVASRALERGQTLSPGDLTLAMLPIHRQSLGDVAPVVGQVLRRDVRAGEAVRGSWLTRAFAVQRGDMVETVIRRGAVVARGHAQIVERGRVGDIVRVQVGSSRRTLRARVIDNRRVEVIR